MIKETDKFLENVSKDTQLAIHSNFDSFLIEAEKLKEEASMIVVENESQTELMQTAREVRLSVKKVRCEAENRRKELKAESLAKGKAIDSVAKLIKDTLIPIEKHLQNQEDFVKIKEAEERRKLKENRVAMLSPYVEDVTVYNLEMMSEKDFSLLLESSKLAQEIRIEKEKRLEQERIEAQRKEAEERKRLQEENEKLKKENEKRMKEAQKAREKADALKEKKKKNLYQYNDDLKKLKQVKMQFAGIVYPECSNDAGISAINRIKKGMEQVYSILDEAIKAVGEEK